MGITVGLTGGLACGKTYVSQELERLGCLVVHADALGHHVLEPGGEAYEAAVREFGRGILDVTGSIDRRALAAEVFDRPERLARLAALVHPPVRERIRRTIDEYFAREPEGIAVVEAAILIETGSYRNYDKLILVSCTPEQQVERAVKRDGITPQEALSRIQRQMPLKEKLGYADYIIDTSGAKENTVEQTRSVYAALRNTQR